MQVNIETTSIRWITWSSKWQFAPVDANPIVWWKCRIHLKHNSNLRKISRTQKTLYLWMLAVVYFSNNLIMQGYSSRNESDAFFDICQFNIWSVLLNSSSSCWFALSWQETIEINKSASLIKYLSSPTNQLTPWKSRQLKHENNRYHSQRSLTFSMNYPPIIYISAVTNDN